MLRRPNHPRDTSRYNRTLLYKDNSLRFFHFDLSEKNHEVVLPIEEETAWDQLHEITWDPGRGD